MILAHGLYNMLHFTTLRLLFSLNCSFTLREGGKNGFLKSNWSKWGWKHNPREVCAFFLFGFFLKQNKTNNLFCATWEIWAWLLCWGGGRYVQKWGYSPVGAIWMGTMFTGKAIQTLLEHPSLTDCLDQMHASAAYVPLTLTSEGSSAVGCHCWKTLCARCVPWERPDHDY